jgi:hypothetical protein
MLFYFTFIVLSKLKKSNWVSKFFLEFNNYIVKKRVKKGVGKIAILLPHCLQNYECIYKVTSVIENCRFCGRCKIGDVLNLKKAYCLDVKVATGGTLARKYLKETKPQCIVAVACERDLISGIYDAFPMPAYGVFNKRPNGPCIDTEIDVEEILQVLKELKKR